MKFTQGDVDGLWVIDLEPIADHRGFFARSWSRDEFEQRGMSADWAQSNLQVSPSPGTLRGIHYQRSPHEEAKLVRCTRGAVFDVSIDLRPASPTYLSWFGIQLDAESRTSVWSPRGCAHGYVSLEPDSEVFYLTSHDYTPSSVGGIRHDDPAFDIRWPRSIETVPDGHDAWPFYTPEGDVQSRQPGEVDR